MAYSNTLTIDAEKLSRWMQDTGISNCSLARELNRSEAYIRNVKKTGVISPTGYAFLCRTYNLPEDTFIKKKVQKFVKPEQTSNTPHEQENGYWLKLKYSKTCVKVQLMFGDEVIIGGVSKIRGDTQLDFMQAISYATHMCYKFSEQRTIEDQENKGGRM